MRLNQVEEKQRKATFIRMQEQAKCIESMNKQTNRVMEKLAIKAEREEGEFMSNFEHVISRRLDKEKKKKQFLKQLEVEKEIKAEELEQKEFNRKRRIEELEREEKRKMD